MAQTFASLVVETAADNRALEAGMRESEQIVEATSDQMVASLTRVTTSVGGASLGADKMTRSFAAVGAAGSLAGSQFGGMASQVAGLGGAMASLGVVVHPLVLALAGIALATVAIVGRMKEGEDAVGKFNDALDEAKGKTEALAVKLALLRGEDAELIAIQQSRQISTEQGFTTEQVKRQTFQVREQFRFTQLIAKETARQATVAKFIASEQIKTAAAVAAEVKDRQIIASLEDRLAVLKGADPLNFLDVGIKQKTLLLDIRITEEKKKQQELEDTLARSQEAKNRALAQQLLIRSGFAKPSDFVSDPTERRLLQALEQLSGVDAALGGGRFTIGSRSAEGFRFGAPTGAETFGQQTEQAKQTTELKKLTKETETQTAVFEQVGFDLITALAIG